MNSQFNSAPVAPVKRQRVHAYRRRGAQGRTALAQARIILLVMINIAQLWVLSATVEAVLARRFSVMWPLVIASGISFIVTVTLLLWWRPASGRYTSSGYVKDAKLSAPGSK